MNKLISVVLFLATVAFFSASAQKTSSAEGDHLRIKISEEKIDKRIKFSVKTVKRVYGKYPQLRVLTKNNLGNYEYILETYDSDKKLRMKYVIPSSRFRFWDGRNGGGGITESDKGTMSIYLPYDKNDPILFIKVDDKGKKTEFLPITVQAK